MITMPQMGMVRRKVVPAQYVSQTSLIQGPGSASFAISKPTGVVAGDLLLFFLWAGDIGISSPSVSSSPGGFPLVTDHAGTLESTKHLLACYKKIAGGSEPADYTWSFSTSFIDFRGGVMLAYRNAHATQIPVSGAGSVSVSTDTHAQTTITPLQVESTLVYAWGINRAAAAAVGSIATPPAGMVQRYFSDFSSLSEDDKGLAIYDQTVVDTAATGSRTLVTTHNDISTHGIRLAIRALGT